MGFLDQLRDREIRPLPDKSEPGDQDDDKQIDPVLAAASDSYDGKDIAVTPLQNQAEADRGTESVEIAPAADASVIVPPTTPPEPSQESGSDGSSGSGDSGEGLSFPEENAELSITQIPELVAADIPDSRITEITVAPDPLAVQFLAEETKLKGQPQPGLQNISTFKPGQELGKSYDRSQQIAANQREARAATQQVQQLGSDPERVVADDEAADIKIMNMRSAADFRLIGQKLKKFSKIFYLNPMMWDSRTVEFIIRSYTNGVAIKAIYDKVSTPQAVFADAAGNTIPTFRQTRAEIGNLRLIDIYALLATLIFKTSLEKGVVTCLDGKKFATTGSAHPIKINGLAGIRRLRHDGEIHPTTFVDMIFFDALNPGQFGHGGLSNWLKQYDEGMAAGMIRRLYDSLLTKFRDRWKLLKGITPNRRTLHNSIAGTATGHKVLRQLDNALTNHTAILDGGGRRFLLMEWAEDLPTALVKFSAIAGSKQPSDLRLFLRKFIETFDPAVPFNTRTIEEIRQSMGTAVAVEQVFPVQGVEETQPIDTDADPFE